MKAASPCVHVCGRVGDVHFVVSSRDAREDVDLASDFRPDEGGGQGNTASVFASEGNLSEESAGVRSPVCSDEAALVGASPRQADDIDA